MALDLSQFAKNPQGMQQQGQEQMQEPQSGALDLSQFAKNKRGLKEQQVKKNAFQTLGLGGVLKKRFQEKGLQAFAPPTLTGAAKGTVKLGLGMSELGQRTLSKVPGLGHLEKQADIIKGQKESDILKSEGLVEKGSELIPSIAALSVPAVASGGAGLPAIMGGEFLTGGLMSAVERGEFNPKKDLTAGAINAAFPALGKVKNIGAAKFTQMFPGATKERMASRVVNNLINPAKKYFSFGKDPGKGIVDEKIVATTFDDLKNKVVAKVKDIGSEIGGKVKESTKAGTKIDTTGYLDDIDEALVVANHAPETNAAIITRLQAAKNDLTKNLKPGKEVTPDDIWNAKQVVSDMAQFTNDVQGDAVLNDSLVRTYGRLKGALGDAVPGLRELNERYANIKSASLAIKNKEYLIEKAPMLFKIKSQLALGTGTALGIPLGPLAPVVGVSAAALERASSSTLGKTAIAQMLRAKTPAEREIAKRSLQSILGIGGKRKAAQEVVDRE